MSNLWRGIILVALGFYLTGCISTKSLQSAVNAQSKVATQNKKVIEGFQSVATYIRKIRVMEETRWNAWISVLEAQVNEKSRLLTAMESDPKPEFLDRVSGTTQANYREIIKAQIAVEEFAQRVQNTFSTLSSLKEEALNIKIQSAGNSNLDEEKRLFGEMEKLIKKADKVDSRFSRKFTSPSMTNINDIKHHLEKRVKRFSVRKTYYSNWVRKSQNRTQKILERIQAFARNKQNLESELNKFKLSKEEFLSSVDQTLLGLKNIIGNVKVLSDVTSEATRQVVESIQKDIEFKDNLIRIADIALKVTTGLSVANVISEADAQKVTQLLDTSGQIFGMATAEAKQEVEKIQEDLKSLEKGKTA